MAVLAAYTASGGEQPLGAWLADGVFAGANFDVTDADPAETAAAAAWLDRYAAGLAVERTAVVAVQ